MYLLTFLQQISTKFGNKRKGPVGNANLVDSWEKYQQCFKHGLVTFATIKTSSPLHIAHEFPEEERQITNQLKSVL